MLNFLSRFLKEFNLIPKIFNFFLSYFNGLVFLNNTLNKNHLKTNFIVYNYKSKNIKLYYFNEFYNEFFLKVDSIWSKFFSISYLNKDINLFRSYFRILSSKEGFYFNFNIMKKKNFFYISVMNSFLSGFKFIYLGFRFWLLPLVLIFSIIYFTLVLRSLPFNKIMFGWLCIIMFVYWLISGFVFFFKKYQFGKYTTSVQRFWRRSYILFWMIEGGTFLVFLYFTLNSSQESFYMYDQISVLKTHLYSWKYFLLKLFPIVILVLSTYLLLLSLKWNLYSKQSFIILLLTFFLTYLVWLEFYQFFHVVNFYGNLNWIYDIDDHSWSLELEPRKTRIVNHYVMLLFILKFWHIMFIYGFWIFFVLRCWETKRIRYPLLSANFQNFIILYIFAWVFMYPWFKFYFRKFLDIPYYWFYVNNRKIFLRVFFNDIKLIYYGLYLDIQNIFFFKKSSFFYWKFLEKSNSFENFKKSAIRDRIISNLYNIK